MPVTVDQKTQPKIVWRPNPGRQEEALRYRVYEMLYGGARGGGKTEMGIIWLLRDNYHLNPLYRALVIRRNFTDVEDWVDRAKRKYEPIGARYIDSKKCFIFPGGAKIVIGHLADKEAYTKYQGHEYHSLLVEELTQVQFEADYEKLISSCRSTVDGLIPGILATTNPTGKGHGWVKARFVSAENNDKDQNNDPVEPPPPPLTIWFPHKTGRSRLYIPSTIEDNPQLMEKDPGYLRFLDGLPSVLRKAWRYGSWDVGAGQFFDSWHPHVHVVAPFVLPKAWPRFISIDYGYAKPSAVYWHCLDPINKIVYTYRELYGPGMLYSDLAQKIAESTPIDEEIQYIIADSSMRAKNADSGKSGFEIMREYFVKVKWTVPLHGTRKFNGSRIMGWNIMREYLKPVMTNTGQLKSRWYVFKTCVDLIRVMPLQLYDEKNPEDLDTELEDHAPDSVRYFFQSLAEKLIDTIKDPPKKRKPQKEMTNTDMWDAYNEDKQREAATLIL